MDGGTQNGSAVWAKVTSATMQSTQPRAPVCVEAAIGANLRLVPTGRK